MNKITLAIGGDHRGFAAKSYLIQTPFLGEKNIIWIDVGCSSEQRCDYPVYAQKVCQEILEGRADMGVLICGSGIGMSIAANRFKSIYAGLVCSSELAQKAREDDNVNVLVLPADYIDNQTMQLCVQRWLESKFLGGRYADRLEMLDSF